MPPSEPPPPKNRRRLWLFRIIATTLVPALLLVAVELALRVTGYGHPTSFLIPDPDDPAIATGNEQFGLRFFPAHLSRSPRPLRVAYQKPAGTLRVVVLGGSAAMGDPDPAIGLPRMLQAVLEARLPDRKIEVVNAAMTAINSHVVREIARDCGALDPDAFLLYMGNNEVLGPFGANTVFGEATPPVATVRANLALRSTRLGQLLHSLTGSAPPAQDASWRGMAMFLDQQVEHGAPALETVRTNFLANLASIAGTGTPLVLSTVASNLRDCPPFAGDQANAAFATATTTLESNKTTEAAREFTKARDHDTLRFRTDSTLNETVRTFAAEHELPLVDTVQLAAENSPHGIPGHELFYEHVHLTPQGNHLLATAFAETLLETLGITAAAPAPSLDACLTRLGHTAAHRIDTLTGLRARLSQPPFSNQANHKERDASLAGQITTLRSSLDPEKLATARTSLAAQTGGHPNDWLLHRQFATLLASAKQHAAANDHWARTAALMPHYTVHLEHGQSLNRARDWPAAETALRKAIAARPDLTAAHASLGIALSQQSRFDDAFAAFAEAFRLDPADPTPLVHWAQVLENQQKPDAAIAKLRTAVEAHPDHARSHYHLGRLLNSQSRFDDALPHYTRAAELEPANPAAHINLALLHLKLGDPDAARQALGRALEIDPGNRLAKQQLDALNR